MLWNRCGSLTDALSMCSTGMGIQTPCSVSWCFLVPCPRGKEPKQGHRRMEREQLPVSVQAEAGKHRSRRRNVPPDHKIRFSWSGGSSPRHARGPSMLWSRHGASGQGPRGQARRHVRPD